MLTSISCSHVYVLDQDQALGFYVGVLGMQVHTDADLGFMRWLTVCVPGERGRQILLERPGPPALDDATAAAARDLLTKGAAGGWLMLTTDDASTTYEQLKAKGVEFTPAPTEKPYGIDFGLRDPFGNHLRVGQVKATPQAAHDCRARHNRGVRRMVTPEPVLARVGQLAGDGQADPVTARRLLLDLWDQIGGAAGEPLHRCAVAHALADVQADVGEELRWDLTALTAASAVTDERLTGSGAAGSAQGLFPSLHLNVADCYRRLGDTPQAQQHIDAGLAAVVALPDDGYGQMIAAALGRISERLHG